MKEKNKLKVLVKVTQRKYKNPEIQKVIDMSMIEVCTEDVPPEQVFSVLLFLFYCFYHNGCFRKKSK